MARPTFCGEIMVGLTISPGAAQFLAGKENVLALFHQLNSEKQIATGRSVHNTRIEGFWSKFRPAVVDHYVRYSSS
jgi:hypothetical protein